MAAVMFGHAGCGMTTSSPVPDTMRMAIWIACMPPPVTKKRSARTACRRCARDSAASAARSSGMPSLMGVERLAGASDFAAASEMKAGVGQVALAHPERDQSLPPAAVIEYFDNAAFRRVAGFAAQGGSEISDTGIVFRNMTLCRPAGRAGQSP